MAPEEPHVGQSGRVRRVSVLQRLGERFWFRPALLCVAAFVLAEGLIALDRWRSPALVPDWMAVLLYRVGESGSRDILGAIASSSLAVAGTTFSITIAVLALTSSSYGPRLVRNFMADRGNQAVLGVFVATFLYSLLVLRSIRVIGDPGDQDGKAFVPHLAVNAAVLLAVLNVAVLVYFIHHISDSIQVSSLASSVRQDLLRTVDRLYPAEIGHGGRGDEATAAGALPEEIERYGMPVTAARGGYVQSVDDDELMGAARRHDVLIALRTRPGQYVLDDTVIALVHPPARAEAVAGAIQGAFHVADARSPYQDPEFGVQQLTEMAVRALSPSTNDPYTAINALSDLSVGLARLAARTPPSATRLDEDGTARVHAPAVSVAELIGSVIDAMRWHAAAAPGVMHATLGIVELVGDHARTQALRAELAAHVDLLEEAFTAAGNLPHDVARLTEHAAAVRASLVRPGPGDGEVE